MRKIRIIQKKKVDNIQKKTGGLISRQQLYAVVSKYSIDSILVLADLMKNSRHEGVRMGAARALLDKALPDLKATELSGLNGSDLQLVIKIVEDKPHDTTRDQELSSTAENISEHSTVQDST